MAVNRLISKLPERARVVVVGGGVIGNSVAYHLAHTRGWGDEVVLLERDQITSGTTWHAAGLMVTFGSTSETSTELRKYSRDLYSRLEAETGQATGFKQCGFIELAVTPDRLEEQRRVAAFNRKCGVNVHELGPREVKELFPLCKTEDVLAGFYVPEDGRVNPVDVSMALAKGARQKGARIFENVSVNGFTRNAGKVTGVKTECGHTIETEYVVNCCGMWARQMGELAGVNVPLQAAEHYYLITDAISEVDPSWPVIEDPENYTYIRPEGGGLMVGLFESHAAAWNVDKIPNDCSFTEIQPDWDRLFPYLQAAMERVPRTLEVGAKKFFCGPESFTPDLNPIVGEAPELKNFFVAAGLNSIGILTGGGIGRLVANWITEGKPDMDVTGINIDRLQRYQSNPKFRADRVVEALGLTYATHYPTKTFESARNVKQSPLHDRLAKQGACFRDVSGWECPDWYAPPGSGVNPEDAAARLSWGRHDWFEFWKTEHEACREGVILMDMSFMSKFVVQGPDAGRILNWISNNNVDGDEGITYTQFLSEDGTVEADLTVCKIRSGGDGNSSSKSVIGGDDGWTGNYDKGETNDRFLVVATDTAHRHVETHMRRAICENQGNKDSAHATVTDVTAGLAQINVQGPHSRELLSKLTSEDLSNDSFPFRTAREIDIGFARALCVRITYLGELGYELFVPTCQAVHVYDHIVSAGKEFGLVHAGLKALSSLRLEKAYKDFGHDVDNTDTVLEAGLGFACDFGKKNGFKGQEAVLKMKAEGPLSKRLVQVLLKDPEPMLHHAEVILRDGQVVGDIRAGSYGHTLGGAVGIAHVNAGDGVFASNEWIKSGKWEVNVAGTLYPAEVSLRPMYDPQNKRIKL
eukprot:g6407.t1